MHICMNWSAMDFDWNQVRAFLATIEEGSLSAAARALGQTQPTLGRQVTALEDHLSVTLFERAGRQLIPTPAALEMAEHVRAMGEAAIRLSLVANGQSSDVEGIVKITATEGYAVHVLPAVVAELAEQHPGLIIEIIATDSLSDLRRREADIALRSAEPTDPDLIARKIRIERAGMFATQGFIAKHGPFNALSDLEGIPFVGIGNTSEMIQFLTSKNVPVTEDSIVAQSDNHMVHLALTQQGLGVGVNGWDVGAPLPDLIPLFPDEVCFEFPLWLVAPQELRKSRRVRIVFDALADHLTRKTKSKTLAKSA